MRKQKTQKVTKEIVVSERAYCDWCGDEIVRGVYGTRTTDIKLGYGSSYSDGGHITGWQVEDICRDCGGKLRNLLEDNGITTKDWEVDW